MEVTKTLVVGLGSTGTEICEIIAERIRWELGSLNRAPWVRFLCLETNATTKPEAVPSDDFIHLGISATDYSTLLANPSVFDPQMDLTKWVDMDTLKKIPTGAVTAGAGNIRMVGRLAFLFPNNYNRVYLELISRLQSLRNLTAAKVQEVLGDNTVNIGFANNGFPVIFVVGTLCGGTCSGIASDFGFFLKAHRQPDEDVIGFFTIPRADLTVPLTPKADTYKKNAYSALVELNHYHMPERKDGKDIRFPDGLKAPTDDRPYDILYIASPKEAGARYNEQLHIAIGDYIFLTAFVPALLPQSKAVDGAIPSMVDGGKAIVDLGNQAHVFCGFGLSTIEFPVQRIVEACTYQLCSDTLGEWLSRPAPTPEELGSWLSEIGLEWEQLKAQLFAQPDAQGKDINHGKDYREEAKSPLLSQIRSARTQQLHSLIDRLRKLYEPVMPPDESPTAPGRLYQYALSRKQKVAEVILERIQQKVKSLMSNYYEGPARVEHFLKAVDNRLGEIENTASADFFDKIGKARKKVDGLLNTSAASGSGCVSRLFPFLAPKPEGLSISHLNKAVEEELNSREDALLGSALRDVKDKFGNVTSAGIISIIRAELNLYRKRASELTTRLAKLRLSFSKKRDALAKEKPNLNGFVLFEPEIAGDGTVQQEFQHCLQQRAGVVGKTWQMQRTEEAKEIVGTVLAQLADDVTRPSSTPVDKDWLLKPIDMNDELSWIPREVRQALLERARLPFDPLRFVDVLERWRAVSKPLTPANVVDQVRDQARLFLDFNEAHATAGGRPPVMKRPVILVPNSIHRADFLSYACKGDFMNANVQDCPDPYRVVFVQDYFRFPLRGVMSVTAPGGIAFAQSNEYPTFFTRKDVFWLGVTEEENERLGRAEELVAVALLLGIVQPQGGAIQYQVQPMGFGDDGVRRLPLSIRQAAIVLSREDSDIKGRLLSGNMDVLKAQIAQRRKGFSESGGDPAFVEFLNNQLIAGVGAAIPDWDEGWLAERLTRFCGRDRELLKAYDVKFPPDPQKIAQMKRAAGEPLPVSGKPAPKNGIYCLLCGGEVGATEEEAAQRGWRCFVNPDHYFGQYIRRQGGSHNG